MVSTSLAPGIEPEPTTAASEASSRDDGALFPSYRRPFESVGVGLAIVDVEGRLHEVNPAFCQLTGRSRSEMLHNGLALQQLSAPGEVNSLAARIRTLCASRDEDHRRPLQLVRSDGSTAWIETMMTPLHQLGSTYLVVTAVDITEQRQAEAAFRDMSFYDSLTGLPNRRLLQDRLQTAFARARREKSKVALLFIDLDRFKPVNDTFGHEVGDWLLKSATQRLTDSLRAYDTAARFGGDEFVVLIPDLAHSEDALRVAERIQAGLGRPFTTDTGLQLQISASIGMAVYPDHADSERDLLHACDEAMYVAKKSGSNRIVSSERVGASASSAHTDEDREAGLLHLRWEQKYASGHVAIDAEHRELFRQASQLLNSLMLPDVRLDLLRAQLARLLRLVASHFDHEEDLLAQWQYPDLAGHALQHRRLIEHAEQIGHLLDDQTLPTGELLRFLLAEMIRGHILAEDSKYFYLIHGRPES
jgi:diguanylate cyclase (GGDEF)-like protein/hemerythrin-like metal-binding protein/PAS domain S-box-containing protein